MPGLRTAFNAESPSPSPSPDSCVTAQGPGSDGAAPGAWPDAAPDMATSVFSWLPAGVAVEEQEALELGVQRTGPYFLSSTAPAIDDVVEVDMRGGPRSAHGMLQAAEVPVACSDPTAATTPPRALVPVAPFSPGNPPTEGGAPRPDGPGSGVWWSQPPSRQGGAGAGTPEDTLGAAAMNGTVRSSAKNADQSSQQPAPRSQSQPSTEAAGDHASRRSSTGADAQEPYTLTAVGHSLGGAALLMYIVQFRRSHRRHRLSRLVLLTPAGFIERLPVIVRPVAFLLPTILQLTTCLFPRVLSLPVFVPSSLLRSLMFRLTADMKHLPALTNLFRCRPYYPGARARNGAVLFALFVIWRLPYACFKSSSSCIP